MVFTKISSSTIFVNINNNKKCFLGMKSAYKNHFWRVMAAENWDFLLQQNITF